MVMIKKGNILNCTEDIIVHQVNVQGCMGGGLAKQLANRYPGLEKAYNEFCKEYGNEYKQLQHEVFGYEVEDKIIANMFSQKPNFDTDYKAMNRALTKIKRWAESNNKTIAIPRNIGNGIANGIDGMAEKIIRKIFDNTEVIITMYEL